MNNDKIMLKISKYLENVENSGCRSVIILNAGVTFWLQMVDVPHDAPSLYNTTHTNRLRLEQS